MGLAYGALWDAAALAGSMRPNALIVRLLGWVKDRKNVNCLIDDSADHCIERLQYGDLADIQNTNGPFSISWLHGSVSSAEQKDNNNNF